MGTLVDCNRLRTILDCANAANDALIACGGLDVRKLLPSPRVVVMGNQSHGKSSVISRLMNIKLPSKTGLCTRAPLCIAARMNLGEGNVAQLSVPASLPAAGGWQPSAGSASHPGRCVKSLLPAGAAWPPSTEALEQAVTEATNALVGVGKNITDKELLLELESPDTPTLDIIDLPGLTSVNDDGQPLNMPQLIEEVVVNKIKDASTIIVLVVSGAEDLATSTALKVARAHDAKLQRTIVVLTKLDLLRDTSVQIQKMREHLEFLYTNYEPLDVVLVQNKDGGNGAGAGGIGQFDEEAVFIQQFRDLQSEYGAAGRSLKLGVHEMVKRLSSVLEKHYEEAVPELRKRIKERLDDVNAELAGIPPIMDGNGARDYAKKCFQTLSEWLVDVREGSFDCIKQKRRREAPLKQDPLFSNLQKVQKKWFKKEIVASPFMNERYYDELGELWEARDGIGLPEQASNKAQRQLYIKNFSFELKRKLHALLDEATEKVKETYDSNVEEVFAAYPKLAEEAKRVIAEDVIAKQRAALRQYLDYTHKAHEVGELYTLSPMYQAGRNFYDEYVKGDNDAPMVAGALGVEALLLGRMAEEGTETVTDVEAILRSHRKSVKDVRVDRSLKELAAQQWELHVYTTLVHNSLMDVLPRVIRMFLITEVIDKVGSMSHVPLGGDLDIFPSAAETLANKQWLLENMEDERLVRRRDAKLREKDSLSIALAKLQPLARQGAQLV